MASAGVGAEGIDPRAHRSLREALAEFSRTISDHHLDRFRTGTEMKFKCECHLIQRDQERVTALSNLKRIQPFYLRLQELEVILNEFYQGDSYVSYIWGAVQFLIRAASTTLRDGSDSLLNAYERIGRVMPKLRDLNTLFLEAPGLRRCLAALYSDLLKFHSGAYQCFTQFSEKGRKKIFKSAWEEFKCNDLNHLEAMVRKHRGIIEYAKQFPTHQPLQAHGPSIPPEDLSNLRRMIYEYEVECDREEQEYKRRESARRKDQFESALRWILMGQDDSSLIHDKLSAERMKYPGTYEWIDKIDSVANWMNEPTPVQPILWINGTLGSGKSTLASYLVDRCRGETSAGAPFKPTYFYCDGRYPGALTYLSLCKGLLYRQLMHIHENETFRHLIAHCYDKKCNSGLPQLMDYDTAESLLRVFFEIIPDQYIIVDGLDECEKPVIKQTLRILSSIVTQQDAVEPGRLRLLIISRDLSDIKRQLSSESVNAAIFKIETEHNILAIRLYVSQRLGQFDPLFGLSIEDENEIVYKTSHTAKGAQGMFLFAKVTLDYLERSTSKTDLLNRLQEDHFPKTLEDAYNFLLESLKSSLTAHGDEEPWNKAKQIFGWLICAGRVLHWHEIRCIASIDREYESVELRERGFIQDVQRFCGTLVHVNPGNKVELVHLTAHKFILKSKHVDEKEVQFDLATLCMEYLTFPCFARGNSEIVRKTFASEGFYAFQDYALARWFYHIASVLRIDDLTIDGPKSENFARVLDNFLNRFQDSVDEIDSDSSLTNLERIKDEAREDCVKVEGRPFYDMLLNLWFHIQKHEKSGSLEDRNKPCLRELEIVFKDNRKVIEALGETSNNETLKKLHNFYGQNLYKCPRTRCDYFHEGFADEGQRESHIAQHDRPFLCSVLGCSLAEAGFTSNKDLERHRKNYHPEIFEGQSPFPLRNTRQNNEARFECGICHRRFTRKINLDGHMRSHFGDRPYSCQTCDRKFARLNDLRRHERLHVRG